MIKIPEKQLYILDTLTEHGFEAYIVGGCVRDYLLGLTPHDFDVTTNALPEDVIEIFEKTVPTGIKHGTITVIADGEPIEVTTFRTESGYSDSRHPDKTEFVTDIKFDLSRRDFTVNAMAYNEQSGLIDLFGGKEDLKNRILRAVGDPEKRFSEDALRILRLFRFAAQLDFSIEEKTLRDALNLSQNLCKISSERIFSELYKSVSGKNSKAMIPLIENGGLGFLNITRLPDFEVIADCRTKPNLAFFAFLYYSCEDLCGTLEKLKVSNSLKSYCLTLERLMNSERPKNSADIKELLHLSSAEIFGDFLLLLADTIEAESLKAELDRISESGEAYDISHLKINGKDLMDLGLCGTDIGDALEILRKYVILNPDKNNKNDLTEYAKSVILNHERL